MVVGRGHRRGRCRVGLLRRLTRLPDRTPGLIADLQEEHVDPRPVPGIVAVSAVSLIGGASLGPEKALGSIGGGAGGWISRRRGLNTEDSKAHPDRVPGAYGGLFSSTVIVVMMIMEVARPGGRRFTTALVGRSSRPASRSLLLRHRRRRVPGRLPGAAV